MQEVEAKKEIVQSAFCIFRPSQHMFEGFGLLSYSTLKSACMHVFDVYRMTFFVNSCVFVYILVITYSHFLYITFLVLIIIGLRTRYLLILSFLLFF